MKKPQGLKTGGKFLVIAPNFAKKLKAAGQWDDDYMVVDELVKEIPYMAIGNNELASKPKAGKTAKCQCGCEHNIEYGTSKTLLPDGTYTKPRVSKMVGFIRCDKNGKTYLATIEGKLLK